MPLAILDHPLARLSLSRLRSVETSPAEFRASLRRFVTLLSSEATRDLATSEIGIDTPLRRTTGHVLAQSVALVPILRAGLGMVNPLLELLPDAHVWHLGIYRDEETAQPGVADLRSAIDAVCRRADNEETVAGTPADGLRSVRARADCLRRQESAMSGWLTKAAGALRGEQPEQPDPFESVCACGVRHNGLRRRKPQRIICRQCGTALFVLPRDPYPAPRAPDPRPKKRRKKSGKKGMAAVPPTAPPRFQQVATNVFQVSEKVGRKAASAGAGFGARLHAWLVAFLAIWTPLRLIVLGCLAVCAATVAYTLLVDRSEQAVLDLKAASEAAEQALGERKISVAHEQLTAAVAALDKLRRHDDPLAREIRQLHREVTALREALPIPPLQVVAEADAAHEDHQDAQWQQTFQTQYRSRWVIVDGVVSRETSGAQRGQYAVSLPLRVGPARRGITMHAALADFDLLNKGGKPRTAIFAVQIAGCELSSDKKTWVLRTNAQSAFLWGTLDNYLAAGFTLDAPEDREQVEQILAAQQRVLGMTSAETTPPAAADETTASRDDHQGRTE